MAKLDIVALRNGKINYINKGLNGDKLGETISNTLSMDESFETLDGILAGGEKEVDLCGITMNTIASAQHNGVNISADAIDASIEVAKQIGESDLMSMDGIQSVDGSGIVASVVALNQYYILNSNIAGLDGNIADMESTGKDNLTYKVFSANPIVTKGMGDLADGTALTPLNAGQIMAHTMRNGELVIADAVLSYTFNVKKLSTDSSNYGIARGVTEVVIGDTGISLNDYGVAAQETIPKRTVTIGGKQVTMTVNYTAGTVVVAIEAGALAVGTVLFVDTALDYSKTSEIRGMVGNEIADYDYVAKPVIIGTKASVMDIRQTQQQIEFGLIGGGLKTATEKIAHEAQYIKLGLASRFAKLFGTAIDLAASTDYATTQEKYKVLTANIDTASVAIGEESGLTDNVIVVGGKGLVNAFNMLAQTDASGATVRDINDANGVKYLGLLGGRVPAYYNPLHDTNYPLVDSTGVVSGTPANNKFNTLMIIGTPADVSKRVVISGIGMPILPIDFKINSNSEQEFGLEGKTVLSANKDPRARKLVKKILFAPAD
ncbi:MAG: hypothetical protein ACWGHH_06555 [Sulfurovaceae bacterium]